jgi:sn-glycerol 3-phosphate transport system substrate-binding protein
VNALKPGQKVELVFWHAMAQSNEETLVRLVDAFEASEPDISVQLVNQATYQDLFDRYRAGLETGDLPDLGQFEETVVQQLVDSQSTVDIDRCVDADSYSLDDFLGRSIDYYSTEGVLRAMPWVVSNPVVIFNRPVIEAAGIDPDDPPETFEELREYADKVVESGAARHGMSLRVEPYVNEFLFAKSGLRYVDHANGRRGRATASVIDTPAGRKIWAWWRDMVESGAAVNTGATDGNVDHLLALGTGDAAMTFEASGALGPIEAVLRSGEFEGAAVGVWPLPALEPGGGVPVGDGALWIARSASPEKRAAAWKLVKFLVEPEQQAALAVSSEGGYIPIRESSLEDPALEQLWTEKPFLRIPYEQVSSGPDNPTTAGSVIGDYQGVRDVIRAAFVRMLTRDQSPKDALRQAEREATAAIRAYNERVGA